MEKLGAGENFEREKKGNKKHKKAVDETKKRKKYEHKNRKTKKRWMEIKKQNHVKNRNIKA